MGDFWTGNIIVQLSDPKDGEEVALEKVLVVDWEITRIGIAGNDVGQFLAEMITPSKFYPDCRLVVEDAILAFGQAYKQSYAGFQDEMVCVAAMQTGSHLINLTPRVASWNNQTAMVRETALEGMKYLTEGHKRNREWVEKSVLGALYHA